MKTAVTPLVYHLNVGSKLPLPSLPLSLSFDADVRNFDFMS